MWLVVEKAWVRGRGTDVGGEVDAEEGPGFVEAGVDAGCVVAAPPGPVVAGGGGGGARAAGEVGGLEGVWGGGEVEAAAGGEGFEDGFFEGPGFGVEGGAGLGVAVEEEEFYWRGHGGGWK